MVESRSGLESAVRQTAGLILQLREGSHRVWRGPFKHFSVSRLHQDDVLDFYAARHLGAFADYVRDEFERSSEADRFKPYTGPDVKQLSQSKFAFKFGRQHPELVNRPIDKTQILLPNVPVWADKFPALYAKVFFEARDRVLGELEKRKVLSRNGRHLSVSPLQALRLRRVVQGKA